MFQFANAYSCTIDSEKETVAIQFSQRCPRFGDKGELTETVLEPLSSIIMNRNIAIALGEALMALATDSSEDSAEE